MHGSRGLTPSLPRCVSCPPVAFPGGSFAVHIVHGHRSLRPGPPGIVVNRVYRAVVRPRLFFSFSLFVRSCQAPALTLYPRSWCAREDASGALIRPPPFASSPSQHVWVHALIHQRGPCTAPCTLSYVLLFSYQLPKYAHSCLHDGVGYRRASTLSLLIGISHDSLHPRRREGTNTLVRKSGWSAAALPLGCSPQG